MQSTAFTHSPSLLPLPKTRRSPLNPTFNTRFDPFRASSSSSSSSKHRHLSPSVNGSFSAHFPNRSWSLSSSSSSFKLRPWTSVPAPDSDARASNFELKATSVSESAESSSTWKTVELGALFGLWYLFNIYFNIYNKQVRGSSLYVSLFEIWDCFGLGDLIVDFILFRLFTEYVAPTLCNNNGA
ncbi:hypothetical protein F2P56_019819 [Juglans regia]|uniref:Uncharacterized protein n=1 Tax=Juglans regia TaxID=51240 RepID=A0A833XAC7_JUGRE|nr:hypothetical protein F2P56_019819 [Juglans regia]